VPHLVQDALLPVLPVEGPLRTVAVEPPGGVPVAQHVVAHHREQGRGVAPVQRRQLDPGPGGRVRGRHCEVVQHEVQQLPSAIDL